MAMATNTTPGSIILAGDLTGTANAPELRPTGVTPGQFVPANVIVDAKGRIVWAKSADWSNDIEPMIPDATTDVYGKVQVFATDDVCNPQLLLTNGVLSLSMNDATATTKGKVTVDAVNSYLEIVSDGLMKVKYSTTFSKGIMQAGQGLTAVGGVLSLDTMAAASNEFGVVQIGSGISVTNGVISYAYGDATTTNKGIASFGAGLAVTNGHVTLNAPTATTSNKGLVQIGSNINLTDGVISLPIASDTVFGVAKIGYGLSIAGGSLTVADATTTSKGIVQVGSGLSVSGGILEFNPANLSDASTSTKGIVQIGSNIDVIDGAINVAIATDVVPGIASFGTGLTVTGGAVTLNAPLATNATPGQVIVGSNLMVNAGTIDVALASDTVQGIAEFGGGCTATAGVVTLDVDVFRTHTAQTVTAAQYHSVVSLSGSSVTWNGDSSNMFTLSLTGTTTLNNCANLRVGSYYHFIISGAQTLNYGTQYKFKPYAETQPAGSKSVLSCHAIDANTLYCIMQPNFV